MLLASLLITFSQGNSYEISNEEVEQRARELGMVYRDEVVAFSEQEEAQNQDQVQAQSQTQNQDQKEALQEDESGSDLKDGELKVFIPRGSTSEDIAEILKKNGVIDNTEKFLEVIARKQLSSKLKAGMFVFPKGANLDELVTLLTD